MNQTPWLLVLGTGSGGSVEFIGGPAGPAGVDGAPGATGPQGPVGPIAAPLARYLVDSPDAGLVNAQVIHRGLGPDRVPDVPDVMDDEMLDPTTGYDSTKWSIFNSGPTYFLDQNGGLRIAPASTSQIAGIDQPFVGNGGGNWGFEAKLAFDKIDIASNSHLGLVVRDSTTHHLQCMGFGNSGSGIIWSGFWFSNPATYYNSFINSASHGLQYHGNDWVYLRVYGDGAGNIGILGSFDGTVWFEVQAPSNPGYVATIDRIGIWTYQQDHPGNMYVQYFRRYI